MKVKHILILISIIALVLFGSLLIAQETETETDTEGAEIGAGMIKVQLVNIVSANEYRVILNGKEKVVRLMGLNFSNSDFYIFDDKHYQYAEWLLMDYQLIWIDYDPDRVAEDGKPLVYLYYGPWETELWEEPTTFLGQSNDYVPPKVNFWGEPIEVYDHNTAEPFIDDSNFTTLQENWLVDPAEGRREYIDNEGKKWFLRDLNALMILSGYAEVSDFGEGGFEREEEFKGYLAKAKWCRRGVWSILLKPNPDNEEVCGLKPSN